MEVRRARPGDVGALAKQMKAVVDEGRWLGRESDTTVEELAAIFQRAVEEKHIGFVLEHEGEVVGSIWIHPTGISGVHGLGMSILPTFRGRGWGRRLLDAALNEASAAGIRKVVLEVFPENARAVALYLSSGFEIEGVKRDHYPRRDGSIRSAVMMARFLR